MRPLFSALWRGRGEGTAPPLSPSGTCWTGGAEGTVGAPTVQWPVCTQQWPRSSRLFPWPPAQELEKIAQPHPPRPLEPDSWSWDSLLDIQSC